MFEIFFCIVMTLNVLFFLSVALIAIDDVILRGHFVKKIRKHFGVEE